MKVPVPGGESKRRKAATRKPGRTAHDHARCRDSDCERATCEAYREGREDGFADGYDEGYAAGVASAEGK